MVEIVEFWIRKEMDMILLWDEEHQIDWGDRHSLVLPES